MAKFEKRGAGDNPSVNSYGELFNIPPRWRSAGVQKIHEAIEEKITERNVMRLNMKKQINRDTVVQALRELRDSTTTIQMKAPGNPDSTTTVGKLLLGQAWPQGLLPTNWEGLVDNAMIRATSTVRHRVVRRKGGQPVSWRPTLAN